MINGLLSTPLLPRGRCFIGGCLVPLFATKSYPHATHSLISQSISFMYIFMAPSSHYTSNKHLLYQTSYDNYSDGYSSASKSKCMVESVCSYSSLHASENKQYVRQYSSHYREILTEADHVTSSSRVCTAILRGWINEPITWYWPLSDRPWQTHVTSCRVLSARVAHSPNIRSQLIL